MKRIRRNLAILFLCIAPSLVGCAVRAPSRPAAIVSTANSLALLRSDLDRIFADPNFANAEWGVEILSLDRGEPIYERNATRLYMPASNNKVLTTAAALVRLGPEFRYETRVLADGPIVDGTLKGNLVIVGSGDPSNAPRFQGSDPFRTFKDWASRLKEKGIRRIEGDLLGDEASFEAKLLGSGWEWDDLAYGYAAPVSALQFNENLITIEIVPGEKEGSPAVLHIQPLEKYLSVENKVLTAAAGIDANIDIERGEGKESVVLRGVVPLKGSPQTRTVAVESPANYYLEALKLAMQQEGIDLSRCGIKAVRGWNPPSPQLLWVHSSPPLAEIIKPLLKVSQNLYAESLTRTLGLKFHGEGSFSSGKEVVEGALHDMAIEKGTYYYADGSGLSRRNLVTADLLVRIFKFMYRHRYFQQFYDALPIASVDGTIAGRMKGTKAENNAHAKTGSMAYVRSLSGYVRTADGEMVAFSMIANNFLVTSKMAEYVQDSALERLAAFTRK
jgi:D-alanyl-D-alanine carboxypeptidase/D-alanyl-D-alanine-endopeptidase (penicillin-binding protein 4)